MTVAGGPDERDWPKKPGPSTFAIGIAVVVVAMTVICVITLEFSLAEVWEGLFRSNAPMRGLADPDFGQILSERSRRAFVETLQIAVVATAAGGLVALPLSLWSTKFGAPNRGVYAVLRLFNNVIRAFPDLLWALLFVAAVGIGALPGLLALFFFTIAVITKLTADTLDGIDMGPLEAADAAGARHTQKLRTAVVPQILPAYTSFLLYGFELNLRGSAVLGLVGAGGIGSRLEFFRGQGRWEEVWGIVFMFFLVVFIVERISVVIRRRLV